MTHSNHWQRVACAALWVWLGGCFDSRESDMSSDRDGDSVTGFASDAGACDAAEDAPPTMEAHSIALWPPNHKFHAIAIEDCVSVVDDCDGELEAEFVWASSDEPIDDIGDGHHAPDIRLSADCRRLELRSERQGPKDGRVYKLGVRVVDSAGHVSEAACSVIVDHDQRGVVGADSGEAYRVVFDGKQGTSACDGEPDEPPPPPPPPPPGEMSQNPE